MTALCSGKICTIFPEKGALNFWKACTIALEYSKTPLYVLIYEEQITFALKESGLIQEQTKNEKGKEKLHEQNNLNGKTDKRSGGEISPG